MRKIIYLTTIASGIIMILSSCNEKLKVYDYVQQPPEIISFSPDSGPAGTMITVQGENLQSVNAAEINGQQVAIRHRVSDTEIVIEATANGRTGKLQLSSPEGDTESEGVFTYIYETPDITGYPAEYMVGEVAVFNGTNLNAVHSVKFADQNAEILEVKKSELVVLIPDIGAVTTTTITFTYFNGSANIDITKTGVSITREVPAVTDVTPVKPETGTPITATGSHLHLVESVKIGDVDAFILNKPDNGRTITFMIGDNPAFVDNDNVLPLKFYSFNGNEELIVDPAFEFIVPSYYYHRDGNINPHSKDRLNHFYCLETGDTYSINDYFENVDPLALEMNGAGAVDRNQLSPQVTPERYYSVKPYIYYMRLSGGGYIYGPANNNNRISSFPFPSPGPSLASGAAYGTPIVAFRVLNPDVPAEMAIIDKVKGGTMSYTEFNPSLLNDIDLSSTGDATSDSWSNIPNGECPHFKSTGNTVPRPFAPTLTTEWPEPPVKIDPGTVALVLYYKPIYDPWTASVASDKSRIHKFGLLDFTELDLTFPSEGSNPNRQINVTFNVYWQRTPMP